MTDWTQIAPGVLHARYQPLDISIVVVAGGDGVLLVDTRCNPREGDELRADVEALGLGGIRWVVNTHAHYDHTFGNQVFAADATIYGHAGIAAHHAEFEGPRLAAWAADPAAAPQYDWHGVVLSPPTAPIAVPTSLDLGGRTVELIPLPAGHTDTDIVVHVPDADVWVVGDVIEESGPPMYGSGSYPFGWPDALDALVGRLGEHDIVIPGHGRPVDRAFVQDQAQRLLRVAETIRTGWTNQESFESTAEHAASAAGFPREIVESAVMRGFDQLGAGQHP
jgi:glyoxylase-like metal-dependent hydrolase (beta-lactamase superfamily II)